MLINKSEQKFGLVFLLSLILSTASPLNFERKNVFCFYDSAAQKAEGLAQFTLNDLEAGLQFCTHLIYGYVGLDEKTLEMKSLNKDLDLEQRHFEAVTNLKRHYPMLKILLGLGGERNQLQTDQYIALLESDRVKQTNFIESARRMVKTNNFDGLDLGLQLPRNKPRKPHTDLGIAWKGFKKLFSGDFVVDAKANEHCQQITKLVKGLHDAFQPEDLMLTLTVLPNVNSSWYFDGAAIEPHLDFINLAAFDFVTPARNPEEADYTAPLYELSIGNRLPHYNVNFQIEFWLQQHVPAHKINLGIASYGHAWIMTKESGDSGIPIVAKTAGPAAPLVRSHELGHFNLQQICGRLTNLENMNGRGIFAPLHFESDPSRRYGVYAFRAADEHGEHGLWISYEDPATAAIKAQYAVGKHLGGVALFDLANDDFRGLCGREKFPILRAIKFHLNHNEKF